MKKIKLTLFLALLSVSSFSQEINLHFGQTTVKEGTRSGSFFVAQVRLTEPSDKVISVSYETLDHTAIAGKDYEYTAGTLTFAPGETSKSIQFFNIADDIAEEPIKKYLFILKDPVNATLRESTQALTIKDDDIELNIVDMVHVTEPDEGQTKKMRFTVQSKYPFEPEYLIVGYKTVDGSGTATSGLDYQPNFGNIIVEGATLQGVFEVTINGDNEVEPNEFFEVKIISHNEEVIIGQETQVGVIVDNDGELFFKYDANIKIYSEGELGVEAKTSGEIKLEQTIDENGYKVFIGEQTPLIHSSHYRGLGNVETLPGGSTVKFYSTTGVFTQDALRIKWTIAPFPKCKMPMPGMGFNNCPWFGVFVEGQRSDYTPDPEAGGGFFTIKDIVEDNTRSGDGLSILKRHINKTISLGDQDSTNITITYRLIKK